MSKKRIQVVQIGVVALIFGGLTLACWLKEETPFSYSERRMLNGFPKISAQALSDNSFMEEFETYSQDQFPLRDSFRSLKAIWSMVLMGQKDNNGIYFSEGHLSKLDYPLVPEQLAYGLEKIEYLYYTYLEASGGNCYLAIIPDKNYYLTKEGSYPGMDYNELYTYMDGKTPYLGKIDLRNVLSLQDYYYTDTHWKQENLIPVAHMILESMGKTHEAEYELKTADASFYGVYAGQSGLPVEPDRIQYLDNRILDSCKVTRYDMEGFVEGAIYDNKKLTGKDPYEFFLSGAQALIVIENPGAQGEGELIVFRDSFGSSLIPLLVGSYEKITVVDIRYINSSILGEMVEFNEQDVLFLYSTLLLNNSMGMK